MSLFIGAALEVAAVLLLLASIAGSVIVVVLLVLLVWQGAQTEHQAVFTLLAALANALLYAIVWGLHKAGRKCIESAARRNPSKDFGLIWERLYGGALILFGIALGFYVVHEVLMPRTESLSMLVVRLSIACFVAIGAVAIGFQRMTRRSLRMIEKFVKPDDWAVEKYGPSGSQLTGGKKTPGDHGASSRDR